MKSHRDIILFLNICQIGNSKILYIIEKQIHKFFNLNSRRIQSFNFLTDKEKEKISAGLDKINLDSYKNMLYMLGIKYTCIIDISYPKNLREIYDPPALIYYKGRELESLRNPIAFVGSRKSTPYGHFACRKIIGGLRGQDISIVSGMAKGIDAHAHGAAIEAGLTTGGVLASSLDIAYPRSNIGLYDRMADQVLISEYPISTDPLKRNFVMRNRIISGLCMATVVIEADLKSGSLITANYALDQGREVFALPGNIDSQMSRGCNLLIAKGARILRSHLDILEEIDYIKEDKVPYNPNEL